MTLKATIIPNDKIPLDDTGRLKLTWEIFFKNQEKKPLAATAKLDPSTATNSQIATKQNELIQLLRDNKFIDDDASSDP